MVARQIPRPADLRPLLRFKAPRLDRKAARLADALTIDDLRRIAQAPHADGGLRLHRGRRRGRDLASRGPVRRSRTSSSTRRAARRRRGQHGPSGPRRPGRPAVRYRADRLHPDDADRGRGGRGPGRRAARHPVLAVHDGDHVDRGRASGEPARPQLVPALHVEGPRPVHGPGRPGGRRPASTPCWSPSTSRWPERGCGTSATASPSRPPSPSGPSSTPSPGRVVVRLPHHRAAGVRVARPMVGNRRRSCSTRCSTRPSTFEDLAWIRDQWPGKVVVKGIQTVADARRVADVGVDGIVLSNHGGRQLDRAPIPFHLLPDVGPRGRLDRTRSSSTPASCPAPTSSPPSRSVRGSPSSAAPTCTA